MLVAPLIGGLGMLYVIWLLVRNAGFAAGPAATDTVFQLSPWIVALAGLGRVVLDVRERREMDTDELQVVRPRGGRHGVRITLRNQSATQR